MRVNGPLIQAQPEWFTTATLPSAATYPYRMVYDTTVGQFKISDGTNWNTANSGNSYSEITNLTLVASVATGALTISVKNKAGNDPSSTDPIYVGFRSTTSSSGTFVREVLTSALSITVPSGVTLGHTATSQGNVYVYLLDNAGTIELAVCTYPTGDEAYTQNTTTMPGSGGTQGTFYSTTGRSSKAIRQIGRVVCSVSAGVWSAVNDLSMSATVPLRVIASADPSLGATVVDTSNGYGSTNTKIRRFVNVVNGYDAVVVDSATLGGVVNIVSNGIYSISYTDNFSSAATMGLSVNCSQLTTNIESITTGVRLAVGKSTATASDPCCVSWTGKLSAGDAVRAHTNGTAAGTAGLCHFTITKIMPLG